MPEITAITVQKKDKTRCNIEADGKFFCGMTLEAVVQNRLKVGMSVSREELARIQLESEKQTALDKALAHISFSMKTEREVRAFLKRKGYLDEVCDFVVESMKRYGYLDDAAYAAAYAESAAKRKGSRLIASELRKKGISDEAIAAATQPLADETEGARRVLEKYLRGKDPADPKTLRKAYAHLLSKGYDYETAGRAIASLSEDVS